MSYKIRLIPITEAQIKAGFIPKYSFQIRQDNNPNSLKQDDKLIEELNYCLQNTPLAISGDGTFDNWVDDEGVTHFE